MLFTRILVTGANGPPGHAVVQRLRQSSDYDVLATAQPDTARRGDQSFSDASLDVTRPSEIEAVFQDFTPNVVVNCAERSDLEACDEHRSEAWAVNARAVKSLAKRCRETGARLIQISTDFVFNGKRGPYDEEARPDPVNYYGRSKLAGENAVREAGRTRWTIVRTALPYGLAPHQTASNFALQIHDQLSKNEPLRVAKDHYRTPTCVADLAAGIERLIRREETGIYHLAGPELVSRYEIARTVCTVFDLDESLLRPVNAKGFPDPVERPRRAGLLVDKAEAELGYAPRSLEEGLRELEHRVPDSTALG